jgi:hypothetical protein
MGVHQRSSKSRCGSSQTASGCRVPITLQVVILSPGGMHRRRVTMPRPVAFGLRLCWVADDCFLIVSWCACISAMSASEEESAAFTPSARWIVCGVSSPRSVSAFRSTDSNAFGTLHMELSVVLKPEFSCFVSTTSPESAAQVTLCPPKRPRCSVFRSERCY